MTTPSAPADHQEFEHGGLSLAPFRATRPTADGADLATLLCPPYDVIDATVRRRLIAANADNAVAVILPEPSPRGYEHAAQHLTSWISRGVYAVADEAMLYVYEMSDESAHTTRGLMGAVELRVAEDGVILPHENTMAGPVADRLAVMTATEADLEPIFLVYDGGGRASQAVRDADNHPPISQTTTADGITHRLWALTDPDTLAAVTADLAGRRALIADGHHRYATYLERQRLRRASDGAGPWDRGLALLVDSTDYGPRVHAIHRVVAGLSLDEAIDRASGTAALSESTQPADQALAALPDTGGFAAVLTDGSRSVILTDVDGALARAADRAHELPALTELDVTVLHRGLVERVWELVDDVDTVQYAHSVTEAVDAARRTDGFAVLLRPTPVAAVAAVAAAGARMPRKSTLFTPKPASGLLLRRLGDQPAAS